MLKLLPETNYKVQTRIIAVDFTKEEGIYGIIEDGIEGLEIGILVNNVGMIYDEPKYFHLVPDSEKFFTDLIHCNVTSVVQMTRLILPNMVNRQKGLIINISSLSSVVPTPLYSVYAATKAFNNKFSDDLRSEYKQHGIKVQTVIQKFLISLSSN